MDGHHQPVGDLERGRAGEQRQAVAVLSRSQATSKRTWPGTPTARGGQGGQGGLVGVGGRLRAQLARRAQEVVAGDGDVVEQGGGGLAQLLSGWPTGTQRSSPMATGPGPTRSRS